MTCELCRTSGLPANATGVQTCWCEVDLCAACVLQHYQACIWMQGLRMRRKDKMLRRDK